MVAKGKSLPIIRVSWTDAHSHGVGWLDAEEFEEWLNEPGIVISVGVLLHRDKKWLALSMSLGPDIVADCLKIPIGMVKKVERLGTVTAKDMEDKPLRQAGGKKRCHKSFALIN